MVLWQLWPIYGWAARGAVQKLSGFKACRPDIATVPVERQLGPNWAQAPHPKVAEMASPTQAEAAILHVRRVPCKSNGCKLRLEEGGELLSKESLLTLAGSSAFFWRLAILWPLQFQCEIFTRPAMQAQQLPGNLHLACAAKELCKFTDVYNSEWCVEGGSPGRATSAIRHLLCPSATLRI